MKTYFPLRELIISATLALGAVSLPALAQTEAAHEHEESEAQAHAEHEQDYGEEPHDEEHGGQDAEQHEDEESHESHGDQGDHEEKGHDEGGHDEESQGGHEGHEEEGHTATSTVSKQSLNALGARVATAGPGDIVNTVSLPGEVRLDKEAVASISPRYPAQIVEVRARIGDAVAAGDTLAVAQSSQTLQRFELKSLIRGTVIDRHATLGEQLQPSDAAFKVADLSRLWVDIALYPKQIPLVKKGQPVRVTTAFGPKPVQARIDYLDPLVSEQLRTGLARIYFDNSSGQWKPGMFVEAEITLSESSAEVVVPDTALIEYQGETVVFVREKEGWTPRPVTTGARDQHWVAIVSGLNAGEQYVAEGGFAVKADLLKSEFESGHNH